MDAAIGVHGLLYNGAGEYMQAMAKRRKEKGVEIQIRERKGNRKRYKEAAAGDRRCLFRVGRMAALYKEFMNSIRSRAG